MGKTKMLSARITDEQNKDLEKMGGHTEGFNKIYKFYKENSKNTVCASCTVDLGYGEFEDRGLVLILGKEEVRVCQKCFLKAAGAE